MNELPPFTPVHPLLPAPVEKLAAILGAPMTAPHASWWLGLVVAVSIVGLVLLGMWWFLRRHKRAWLEVFDLYYHNVMSTHEAFARRLELIDKGLELLRGGMESHLESVRQGVERDLVAMQQAVTAVGRELIAVQASLVVRSQQLVAIQASLTDHGQAINDVHAVLGEQGAHISHIRTIHQSGAHVIS